LVTPFLHETQYLFNILPRFALLLTKFNLIEKFISPPSKMLTSDKLTD
jgi:hypothetical protein